MRRYRPTLQLPAAFFIVLASAGISSAQPRYTITALFDVPGFEQIWATEINDNSAAVGGALRQGDQWGWRQDGSTIVVARSGVTLRAPTLSGYMLARYWLSDQEHTRIVRNGVGQPITNPLSGGSENGVHGANVNEAGQAAGYLVRSLLEPAPFPFIWQNGVTTLLEPDGTSGRAHDINDHGVVAGSVVLESSDVEPVIWANGTRTLLAPGRGGIAFFIDNADQVLVNSPAFLWDNGAVVDMCPPAAGCDTVGIALNEQGQVALRTNALPSAIQAFRYDGGGQFTNLGTLVASQGMFPAALNDRGNVVGWSAPDFTFTQARAFAFIENTLYDLITLVPPGSGWTRLLFASDINNRGEIVGMGVKDGVGKAFRMTPVP